MFFNSTSKLLFIYISLIITFNYVLSIEHCKTESEGKCLQCEDHFTLSNDTCIQCTDPNCLHCFSSNPNNCYTCSASFILKYKKCGIKCDNIDQCDLCSEDLSQCYHCKHGCQVENGECTCKSRVVVIIVCVIISLIVVMIVFICLSNGTAIRKYKFVRLLLNINDGSSGIIGSGQHHDLHEEEPEEGDIEIQEHQNKDKEQKIMNNYDIKESKEQLTADGSDKIICDYCLLEVGMIRLNCGCYLCKAHKSMIEHNEKSSCPICKKEVKGVSMIKCEMCMKDTNDNTEIKTSKCGCEVMLCKDCLRKVNEGSNECPRCHKK